MYGLVLVSFIQISITSFDYCDSLEPYFDTVDVVIGHAGERFSEMSF